ncbi:MAG TPA: dihydroorotase [Chitinophagaceae bacterium]|nr:dihydroorotase [Chitinophagaceae bacterium]
MKILIRKAHIIDPSSPFHHSVQDIFITDNTIQEIGTALNVTADQVIETEGLHVSPGWVDVFANFNDPGYEFKETLETGAQAAATGGFTHVFVIPNTKPAVDSKSQVEYIKRKSAYLPVNIHPIGAITKSAEGKELAEMYDMRASGSIAFSDGTRSVQSSGLLLKALQYVKVFEGIVIQIPDDTTVGTYGLMNEGLVSTRLGLPGKPAMAEELMVARDLKLARYADSKIHFTGISSAKSLEYIHRSKQGGIQVTASVTPFHLYFTDEDLLGYDTNLKVLPPLRTAADRDALRKAIDNDIIDCIATHHQPHEWDSKTCEFEVARFGMIGLETCFGVMRSLGISAEKFVSIASLNPRRIFGLPAATIGQGEKTDLTLFLPDVTFTLEERHIRSKSKNTPFLGKQLTGRVVGIINQDKLFLNNQ